METLVEAMNRLREAGYRAQYRSSTGALLCSECDERIDPREVVVDEIVRFEGPSDPGDEAILFALAPARGHRGVFVSGYGPSTPPEDAVVLSALDRA